MHQRILMIWLVTPSAKRHFSLLREPAAEWYENYFENATTWAATREQFITRFSDGRNKFRHRMEVEHCVRGDREEIRNFLTLNKEDRRQRMA